MNHSYIATSIIVGFSLVALAIFFSSGDSGSSQKVTATVTDESNNFITTVEASEVPRQSNRHLYGDENAVVTIVEFSDYECSFCSRLSPILKQIIDESEGKIVWEYRHLPLPNHKNAFTLAVASECLTEQLGNDAFWDYSNIIFANIGSKDSDFYLEEAEKLGVDRNSFDTCLQNEEIKDRVEADMAIAQKLGGNGTPFSVIIDQEGNMTPVSGALPYAQWQAILADVKGL